ncbi:DUF4255 domain-containing protein [Undibacterium sp. Ji50W]|uniref:DUF4255 domain-containing protein n=1 Tax=Undibacterium sp. Ji50W TaxID=3413041 RepID=UPI003BF1BF21
MFFNLTKALGELLQQRHVPSLLREADLSYDSPTEAYKPVKNSINLFLFDVRERTDLRSSVPVIREGVSGKTVVIGAPELRIACSYLVTAWVEAGQSGQSAVLRQHELLGEVLKLFAATPVLAPKNVLGETKTWLGTQSFPVELVVMQSDLTKNISEFWTAVGGKLRPAFTVTATVAMTPGTAEVTEALVLSKEVDVREWKVGSENH